MKGDIMSIINDEIVAVITAAINSIGSKEGHKLVVRSIRRMTQRSPVWNATGRIERMGNKL